MSAEQLLDYDTHVVAGTGPYAVAFSFSDPSHVVLRVFRADGTSALIAPEDWSLTPTGAVPGGWEGGSITLGIDAAADLAGLTIRPERDSQLEQGWIPSSNTRETALQAQLDWLTRAVQEAALGTAHGLRAREPLDPFVVVPNSLLAFDENGKPVSGVQFEELLTAPGLSQAWAESPLPPNPEDETSKSSRSWSLLSKSDRELAEQARQDAQLIAANLGSFATAIVLAQEARDKSHLWAEAPEDTEVEAGKYSALHHAAKTEGAKALAEGFKDEADQSRIAALAAQGQSEAARDAAFVAADVYADIATGRAAVANGEQFAVVSSDGREIIRYRRDSSITETEMTRFPSADAVTRPNWAGFKSAWIDPLFSSIELGEDLAGESCWFDQGDPSNITARYQYVPNTVFPGHRALQEAGLAPALNVGPRLRFPLIDAAAGDTITVRAILTGASATGSVAFFYYDINGALVGTQQNLLTPAGASTLAVSSSPVVLSLTVTIPTGAVGARVLPTRSAGSGTVVVNALWGGKGADGDVPKWPIFDGDPGSAVAALQARQDVAEVKERLAIVEGSQGYLVSSAGAVEPAVEAGDIALAVSSVLASSTYGASFRGWAERYTPAGVSFNAVRIRALGRKSDVAAANYWRTIQVVVRAAAAGNAHLGASSTLVAVGEVLVDPAKAVLEDLVIILRDPVTGAVKTLDDSDLGTEYLIGTYFLNAEGGAAYGSPHRGTMSNALGSPQSYYVTTGNPETDDWSSFASNWRLGMDHLSLTNPVDTVVYSPTADFLADLGVGSGAAVPEVFNVAALRQYAKRLTAGESQSIGIIGDSWTNGGYRLHTPLHARFAAAQGISAPGWISANTYTAIPTGGSRSRPGTWTDFRASTAALGVDNCHASTTDLAGYLTFGSTGTVAKFFLHYRQQPGGGQFSWSVSGGAATVVDTDGADGLQVIEIDGPGLLKVDIDTAGSAGITIMGCDVRNETAGQAVLHKLGASGATAAHWAGMNQAYLQAGLAALGLDVTAICLGTNDHAGSVGLASYRASIEALIATARAANPLTDILLIGPGPNGNTGSYTIDDYIRVLYEIAVEQDAAFGSLKAGMGTFEEANARGLYEDLSHNNAPGGRVNARTLWRPFFRE